MKRLLSLLVVAVLAVQLGCASLDDTLKRVIVTSNEVQDTAAKAYDLAVAEETAAARACYAAAIAAGSVLIPAVSDTATGDVARAQCLALGVKIPYDPWKLHQLAAPVNAAYEAVRALNASRQAILAGQASDYAGALAKAILAMTQLYTAAADAGLAVDPARLAALQAEAAKVR